MKRLMFVLALAAGLTAAPGARADYQLSLSSGVAKIANFAGDGTFSFTGPFQVGFPNSDVLNGSILGTFAISNILPDGLGESATVTTSTNAPVSLSPTKPFDGLGGEFMISDGSGNWLTADVSFVSFNSEGTSTVFNDSASVNLTNFQYNGTNADLTNLLTLSNLGDSLTGNFIFGGPTTIDQLASPGGSSTFQGTVTPVPAPASCMLFLTGSLLSGLGFLRRRIFRLA